MQPSPEVLHLPEVAAVSKQQGKIPDLPEPDVSPECPTCHREMVLRRIDQRQRFYVFVCVNKRHRGHEPVAVCYPSDLRSIKRRRAGQ